MQEVVQETFPTKRMSIWLPRARANPAHYLNSACVLLFETDNRLLQEEFGIPVLYALNQCSWTRYPDQVWVRRCDFTKHQGIGYLSGK